MLWSIDSCQIRVSADQCDMPVSRAQVYNTFRWGVFLSSQVMLYNWSQAQKTWRQKGISWNFPLELRFLALAKSVC